MTATDLPFIAIHPAIREAQSNVRKAQYAYATAPKGSRRTTWRKLVLAKAEQQALEARHG